MRILFLYAGRDSDRNTNPDYFKALEKSIVEVARPETQVEVRGLSDNVYETVEALYWYSHPRVIEELCVAAKKAERDGYDCVVIGCVGAVDAEYAIKEILNIPVVGVSETSFLLAYMLGANFSILTYSDKAYGWLYRTVREYQLEHKCVSIRQADLGMKELLKKTELVYEKILEQAKVAVNQDRAEVILLGSIGFAGLADYLRERIDATIVDPVEAGVKFAEIFVDLHKTKGFLHSKKLTYKASANMDKFLKF